jgi:hypothetical protein
MHLLAVANLWLKIECAVVPAVKLNINKSAKNRAVQAITNIFSALVSRNE